MSGAKKKATNYCLAIVLALLTGGLLFLLCGYDPFAVYAAILKGGLGSKNAIVTSLTQALPLMFMGLAYIIGVKAGMINIGTEGQLYAGAMVAAMIAPKLTALPGFLGLLLSLLAAIVTGGLCGMLIAWLKNRFGANEIITAIMLNSIIQNVTSHLANGPLKVDGVVAQTERIQSKFELPDLITSPELSSGLLIVLILSLAMYLFFRNTRLGYQMRALGQNRDAAQTAGIPAKTRMLQVMFLSGAVAGLAGAVLVMGVNHRFIDGFSSGYGWDGIAVASLGGLHVLGNVASSLLFGVFLAGAMAVNRQANIPYDFIRVIEAVIVLTMACPQLYKALSLPKKRARKEV